VLDRYQACGDVLGSQLPSVVSDFLGPATLADAVGQIDYRQRRRGKRQH
jgi:hypothetical protein